MATITFMPSGITGESAPGETVLDAARRLGEMGIPSVCGGYGLCGTCRVLATGGGLSGLTKEESVHLSPSEVMDGFRLACQASVVGDAEILVPSPPSAAPAEMPGLKEAPAPGSSAQDGTATSPAVTRCAVDVPPPGPNDNLPDAARLLWALGRDCGLARPFLAYPALRELPSALREGSSRISATVRACGEVIDVRPAGGGGLFGAAFDVGTTTVAGFLCDLETGELLAEADALNPQAAFGEDVMSRISYAVEGDGGADRLRGVIIDCLNGMLVEMAEAASAAGRRCSPRDIAEAVLVGNTAMHHLAFGLPVAQLGVYPFIPALSRGVEFSASDAGLSMNPAGRVVSLPIAGGFVGSDNAAALAAVGPFDDSEAVLVVDVGTNGEIALAHGGRILVASCATGPAFEGAHIRCGMRAAPGAVERVRIDPVSWEPVCGVIGAPQPARGICGSGVLDSVAAMYGAGILRADGAFVKGVAHKRLREGADGPEYVLAGPGETIGGKDVVFTQADVRAVQLAKAALYAGAGILLSEMGLTRPDRIVLAGAFGNRIDPRSAALVGMIPDLGPGAVSFAGNAAGEGARSALLDTGVRQRARDNAARTSYVELSMHTEFQERFLSCIQFPGRFPGAKDGGSI